jgi:prolipoprotein diacylglyceryltransferase
MVFGTLCFLPVALLFLAGLAFWIWMIVDCATKESNTGNDKLVWIIIVVFTQIIGALIYYFVRRRPRQFAEWQRSNQAGT